jgi:hypothetical protein
VKTEVAVLEVPAIKEFQETIRDLRRIEIQPTTDKDWNVCKVTVYCTAFDNREIKIELLNCNLKDAIKAAMIISRPLEHSYTPMFTYGLAMEVPMYPTDGDNVLATADYVAKEMTLDEIEKALGYKVQIINK